MIRASVEIIASNSAFSVGVYTQSLRQAVELAANRYPDYAVSVRFPLDPEISLSEGLPSGRRRWSLRRRGRSTNRVETKLPEHPRRVDGGAPRPTRQPVYRGGADSAVVTMILAVRTGTRLLPPNREMRDARCPNQLPRASEGPRHSHLPQHLAPDLRARGARGWAPWGLGVRLFPGDSSGVGPSAWQRGDSQGRSLWAEITILATVHAGRKPGTIAGGGGQMGVPKRRGGTRCSVAR